LNSCRRNLKYWRSRIPMAARENPGYINLIAPLGDVELARRPRCAGSFRIAVIWRPRYSRLGIATVLNAERERKKLLLGVEAPRSAGVPSSNLECWTNGRIPSSAHRLFA